MAEEREGGVELGVVVDACGHCDTLDECLEALEAQTLDRSRWELIVAGAGGGRSGRERVAVTWVEADGRGVAKAGAEASSAPVVLLIGGDVIADPELLEEHLRSHAGEERAVVTGDLRLRLTGRVGGFGRRFARWWRELYAGPCEGDGHWNRQAWGLGGLCLSAPRDAVIDAAGGGAADAVVVGLREALLVRAPATGALGELRMPGGLRPLGAALRRSGARAADLLGRHPELGACEPLGTFGEGRARALVIRRGLLAVRAPAFPLLVADRLPGDRVPGKLWDTLRLHLFWTGVRHGLGDRDRWRRLTRGTVILMYHAIGEPREPSSRYLVGARRFKRQVRWIKLRRRPVLSLGEYIGYRQRRELPPADSVVFTFDDGYADNATIAAPILRRAGIPATLFVVAGRVGAQNDWDPPGSALLGRPTMSWEELAALAGGGMEIGAHSVTHPRLGALEAREAEREMREARAELEGRLGVSVANFAYPFGDNTAETRAIARELGFASACGTEPGVNSPATPLYALHRFAPWGTRSLPRFALDLWLGRRVGGSRGDDGQG